jgi:periplasmic protein TonB
MPQTASAEPNPISSFWMNDDGWQVAWPAAIAFAILFHGVAFVAGEQAPPKKKADPIVMAIALPPPPPEVIAPPPEPEPEKPKPKEKKAELPPDIPPPPNETPPVETNEPPPPIVTGVTADSVVEGANSGINVRVGNTTFGDPNNEPLTKAEDVQPIRAKVQFDAAAYRRTAITMINKQKRYPRKARVMGLEGNVIVRVELDRGGKIVGSPVVMGKGSGHDVLDDEAIRMVQAAAPFPDIVGDDVELPHRVVFPVQFRLIDP